MKPAARTLSASAWHSPAGKLCVALILTPNKNTAAAFLLNSPHCRRETFPLAFASLLILCTANLSFHASSKYTSMDPGCSWCQLTLGSYRHQWSPPMLRSGTQVSTEGGHQSGSVRRIVSDSNGKANSTWLKQ